MSGFFDEPPPARPRPAAAQAPQRSRALLFTGLVLVAAFFAVSVFTGIWTDRLWFRSVDYGSVFTKLLGTRILLFVVFGLLMGVFVGLNLFLAYRFRPLFRPASLEQASLDRYRQVVDPLRRWLLIGVSLVLALFAGASGAGKWREFLMWRNASDFGQTDPYFNKDIGFYVFDLPWLHFLVGFAMTATVIGLIAALVMHYLYGGIRLQDRHDRFSGAAQVQVSVLAGLFVLFKAVDYWLDRYDITSDASGLITGVTYTDDHAVLPSKEILTFIALITAVLFFANVFRRTWMLPSVGLALLVLSAILLGVLWPGVVQQFQVSPSEPDKEAPYIKRNIEATRTAYSINGVEITPYPATVSLSTEQLRADAQSIPGIRLLDPALVSDTFEQLQQVRGYYSVPGVLDVDRYPVNGEMRDMVLAVRELNQAGLPDDQRNWANLHTVYTHGFGVVAAYGNQRNSDGVAVENDGEPEWAEQDIPPKGDLTNLTEDGYQARIYFGEQSPQYSIVGAPEDGRAVEFDIPEGEALGSAAETNTYDGKAGVPVGSLFNKLLYAVKFSEPNIVLSNRVYEESKILYDRDPRTRVQKVAPWLTVDGDSYPAVVDGRVVWILDAYTVTDRYPMSEKKSLSEMTRDSLQPATTYQTLPTDEINYIRNSVKAVVDAYDGTVTLYEWDEEDPILKAWSSAFPGVVEPKDSIPADLREHMRYPEDLFKVQRDILAQYHVTQPKTFYEGSDQWEVPQDPTEKSQKQPPYRLSVRTPSSGQDEPVFSLTSVYVPKNRQNLAAFISVDADAAQGDYGNIRVLRLPGSTQIPGPSQIANQFGADQEIQDARLAFTRTNSKVIDGNLLTLPVGDGLLYVQPLYTQRESGEGRYPVLRYVLVSFGKEVGFGPTLTAALDDVLGQIDPSNEPVEDGQPTTPPDGGPAVPGDVESLLQEAEAAFTEAEQALQDGDLVAYAEATERARDLVAQALEAAGITEPPTGDGAASGSGGDAGGDANTGG
ncbi:MAG TPA: UPF0182 family protein [Nocardioidaceae bacterium]|nr:UPF0182 family protein [Nocardioidaceae bacterium]